MKPYGTYKIRYQRAARRGVGRLRPAPALDAAHGDPIEALLARVATAERRVQRVVESLCEEIRDGDERTILRIRRIFSQPREIFRVELERPELGYQRTTLLGREALETLLEADDVRDVVSRFARSA